MTDLALIGFGVETSKLAEGERALDKLGVASKRVAQIMEQEMKKTGTATGMYARAIKEAENAQKSFSAATVKVAQDLTFEVAQMQRSNREQAIHNALRRAGVDATSAEGRALAMLAGRHHDLSNAVSRSTVAQTAYSAAAAGSVGGITSMGAATLRAHPIILALALATGAAAAASKKLEESANAYADRAGKLVDLAQTIGFTTTQLQQLNRVASQVGVAPEQLATSVERFAFGFEQLKRGEGEMREALLRADTALLAQMERARDVTEAFDIYARAIANAASAEQKIALSRPAFGRGGAGTGRVAEAVVDAGGLANLSRQNILLEESLKLVDQLRDQSQEFARTAKDQLASIYSPEILASQRNYNKQFQEWTRLEKEGRHGEAVVAWGKQMLEWVPLINRLLRNFDAGVHIAFAFKDLAESTAKARRELEPLADALEKYAEARRKATGQATTTGPGPFVGPLPPTPQATSKEHQELVGFLGSAATPLQRYQARIAEINAAVAENGRLTRFQRQALAEANREYQEGKLDRRIQLLGDLAGVEAQVAKTTRDIAAARREGANIGEEEERRLLERTRVQAEAAQPENQLRTQREMLFMTESEQRIRQQLLTWGVDWNTERGRALAAEMRMIETMKTMVDLSLDIGRNFATGIVSNLMQGKSLMDSMTLSARNLSQQLASQAVTELFKGNFIGAGASAIGAGVFGFLGSGKTKEEREKERQDAVRVQRAGVTLSEQARIAGLAAGSQEQALAQFDLDTWQQLVAEIDAGGKNLVLVEQKRAAERKAVIDDFTKKAAELEKKAAEDRLEIVNDFNRSLNDATGKGYLNQFTDLFKQIEAASGAGIGKNLTDTLLGAAGQKIVDEAELTGKAFEDLVAQFPQLQGVVHEFVASAKRNADDLKKATESLSDRLFNATTDTTTLEGALLAQRREHMREIAEEEAAGGELLLNLAQVHLAERLQLEKRFADQAIAEAERERQAQQRINEQMVEAAERARQQQLEAITRNARTILEYINDKLGGSGSSLAPLDKLTNAQQVYSQQLALAQQTNEAGLEAQQTITRYAENYLDALKAVHGTTTTFQQGFSTVMNELFNLPSIDAAEDPVVAALRTSIKPVLDNIKSYTETTKDRAGDIKSATELTRDHASTILTNTGSTVTNTANTIGAVNGLKADLNQDGIIDMYEKAHAELKSAINSGSADAIKTALSTNFSALDATMDQAISYTEFLAGIDAKDLAKNAGVHSGMADVMNRSGGARDYLIEIFRSLDQNGDGLLTKAELDPATKDRISETASSSGKTASATTDPGLPNSIAHLINVLIGQEQLNDQAMIGNLAGIYKQSKRYVSVGGAGVSSAFVDGTYAEGGFAEPYSTIMYGEHHPRGPFIGRVGPKGLNITPDMPSYLDGGANGAAADESASTLLWQINSTLLSGLVELGDRLEAALAAHATRVVRSQVVTTGETLSALGRIANATEEEAREAKHQRAGH